MQIKQSYNANKIYCTLTDCHMYQQVKNIRHISFNQKEGLIPRSLLRNKLFQNVEEVI